MEAGRLDLVLLAGAGVLLVAVAGVRLSSRLGVPSLLLYLGIGMLLGEDVIGLVFDDAELARNVGLVALALILAEGGLTTRWPDIRPIMPAAASLATVGVGLSIATTCLAAHYVMDVDWRTAGLVGAMLSSTDAAAVFSTLRMLRLPRRLVGVLEAESGLNDAPAVIVVTLLAARHPEGFGHAAATLGYELAVGAAIGLALGAGATEALRRAALPAAGLYPIATIAFAIGSYAAAASAHASGFLAVYLTTLWLGNAQLPHRRSTVGFAEGVAWLAQIGLFVMLGLLVTPSRLGSAILPALGVGAALLFVARPLSVVVSALPFRFSWRENLFLSAAGLRGAVPIVLTTIPLTLGSPGAHRIFDVVFVLVVMFTLLQAPLLAPLARRLDLETGDDGHDLDVDAAPLDEMVADLLTIRVPATSRL
ncbi:MAG: potassium/hydrogen antiporter, partial [Frankiaceae bacterium]|nr:potassium/hydrogen antiporter [Frankiaceae bacterium]